MFDLCLLQNIKECQSKLNATLGIMHQYGRGRDESLAPFRAELVEIAQNLEAFTDRLEASLSLCALLDQTTPEQLREALESDFPLRSLFELLQGSKCRQSCGQALKSPPREEQSGNLV